MPLLPAERAPKPVSELNPVFEIKKQPHVLVTQAIASIPAAELKRPVGSLIEHHDQVTRALDLLLVGF